MLVSAVQRSNVNYRKVFTTKKTVIRGDCEEGLVAHSLWTRQPQTAHDSRQSTAPKVRVESDPVGNWTGEAEGKSC